MAAEDKKNDGLGRLIWTVAETKEMFQKYRLWPSFVGLSIDQEKKGSKGKLPVMLWEEQHRYLAEMGRKGVVVTTCSSSSCADSSTTTTPSRKRKLGEMEESSVESADGEGLPPQSKKPRTSLFTILHDGIRELAHRASVAFFGAAQWVYNIGSTVTAVRFTNPIASSSSSLGNSRMSKKDNNQSGNAAVAGTRKSVSSKRKKFRDGDVQMTVFRALQDSKYFIGPGDVYGGDYTIYRGGDPSNAHSTATVRVVRQRKITARDLISFSRVQNQVAKSAVLAYLDPETKDAKFVVVNFQTVSDRS